MSKSITGKSLSAETKSVLYDVYTFLEAESDYFAKHGRPRPGFYNIKKRLSQAVGVSEKTMCRIVDAHSPEGQVRIFFNQFHGRQMQVKKCYGPIF
jgi:hypothetical protein